MSDKACIDASVALKWIIEEPDSVVARELLQELADTGSILIAPSLISYEVASVLRQKSRSGSLKPDEAEEAFEAFMSFPFELADDPQLLREAWNMARDLDQNTVYDAVYLALARREECTLWTADEKLFKGCSAKIDNIKLIGQKR